MSLFDKLSKLAEKGGARTRTVHYERTSTKVWVDGKEIDASDGTVDDDLLRALKEELGISSGEMDEMLGHEGKSAMLRSAAAELAEVRAKGPIERVECPGCSRTVVNRTGSCMYCGAALISEASRQADTASTGSQRNTVDEKFLNDEVESTRAEEEQAIKDAFLQRLRRM